MLKRGFEAERAVVAAFASCKKPSDAEFQVSCRGGLVALCCEK
jgi:hypothetical protein